MTEEILKRFNDRQNHALRDYTKVLNFVIGGLLFDAGKRNNNPLTNGVNVEDLFNAVLLLSERNTLEVSPFVGSWDAMIEAFDKVTPSPPRSDNLLKLIQLKVEKQVQHALSQYLTSSSSSDKIDKALENNFKKRLEAALNKRSASMSSSESVGRAVADYIKEVSKKWSDNLKPNSSGSNSEMDRELKQLVTQLEQKPAKGRTFKRTAGQMILMLKDLVWIDDAATVDYLKPILNPIKNGGRLVVATLNYDNGLELVSEANSITCNTGIDIWSQKGVFDFSGDGLHLIKLHGSINWSWNEDVTTLERPMPHSIIRRIETDAFKTSFERPAVIFGQRNKLTAEGPFLDLLRQFQNELEHSTVLTVIGYSLRDLHVNTYISKWLNESVDHKIRIVDPNFEDSDVDYIRQLKGLRSSRPNQVKVIQKFTGEALKELYGN
jgi:hypothetical protein